MPSRPTSSPASRLHRSPDPRLGRPGATLGPDAVRAGLVAVSTGLTSTASAVLYALMHTVIETPTFLSDARAAGVSDDEREHIVNSIAAAPHDHRSCPEAVERALAAV